MIINKIKLHNIRSYVDAEIFFKEGNILLAGDVGSGKSSILLAIDFALFGLSKGSLSGSTLLRNGTNSGYVELNFTIENNSTIIRRNLTKSKTILQDDGYIQVNGILTRCTAMELKQHILTMLNYPKELLTKSKSLIYRYTVYTPQEEMKRILQEENDIRVDTLRKIFGIDKYKRIKENSEIFTNHLRDKSKSLGPFISDIDIKRKELNDYKSNEIKLKNEIDLLKPRLDSIRTLLELKKNHMDSLDLNLKDLNRLKSGLEMNSMKSKYLNNELNGIKKDIEETTTRLSSYSDIKEVIGMGDIDMLVKKEKLKLEAAESGHRDILIQSSVIKSSISSSNAIIEGIKNMDICPVCKQKVVDIHKNSIKSEEAAKISGMNDKLVHLTEESKSLQNIISKIRSAMDVLNEERQKQEINSIRLKNFNEVKSRLVSLAKKMEDTAAGINSADDLIRNIRDKIGSFGDIDQEYSACKIDLEKYQLISRELDIKYSSINTRFFDNKNIIAFLEKELSQKTAIKEKIQNMEKIKLWLGDVFFDLVDSMEKKVMSKLYSDFNDLFKKWFNIIMGDEGIIVSVDSEFNPVIEQNGYNAEYLNLSGGEKTAVALAYRLALNQVINHIVSNIRTNDLIILDEPTDGFSDDQINRIKNVLDELDIKQVIIVSHEPKIESFVDDVIRIRKENHVSSVL